MLSSAGGAVSVGVGVGVGVAVSWVCVSDPVVSTAAASGAPASTSDAAANPAMTGSGHRPFLSRRCASPSLGATVHVCPSIGSGNHRGQSGTAAMRTQWSAR
ncbi:hypothetical protein ARHIZOSPH14_18620 [Agromyces rhizosphaerae]|uniref:Uncharacterized protein n=1 Tax=Agromyces rhizosphaerae TaxID=88374 RepID=A0A9W6CXS8_9MICO|nr:hypothetical protein ARHIZOSPH14_18620 [Agromyces rhizosphaerae]